MLKAKFVYGLRTFGLVGASVLMLSQPVWANPISDELLTRYHQVMNTDAELKAGLEHSFQMSAKVGIMYRLKKDYPNMTSEQQAQVDALLNDVMVDSSKEILADTELNQVMRQFMDQTIKKHFNAEEVQAMIDFYQTPIGQGLVKKTSVVMLDLVENMPKVVVPILPKLEAKYSPEKNPAHKARIEKFINDVKDILGEPEQAKKSPAKPEPANKKKKR